MARESITIIVPVYGDWPSLKECIESLIKYVDTAKNRVMLVNDCGPEVDLIEKHIKQSISNISGFSYFRNKKNLGFVKTCNRAVLEMDKSDNDILLLNSDTKVTQGFLEEMSAVLNSSRQIGAVSPRTNNATICTIPLYSIRHGGKGIEASKSYDLYKRYKDKFPRYNKVPTAHGFCMLIKRTVIEKYGLFDEIFGRGYGEEVDFCQRIINEGYVCALSNKSYVYHLEAKSFSLETKAKLLETNNQIIRKRYPNYQQQIRDYIQKALEIEAKIYGQSINRPTILSRVLTKFKR